MRGIRFLEQFSELIDWMMTVFEVQNSHLINQKIASIIDTTAKAVDLCRFCRCDQNKDSS